MKNSLYNTLIPLADGNALLYNALTDRYLAIRADLSPEDLADPGRIPQGPLRDSLVEIGAIVPRDTDEVAAVRDMIRKCDYDGDCFQLHVNPTVDCNFRCWYCYEDHRKGSRMGAGHRAGRNPADGAHRRHTAGSAPVRTFFLRRRAAHGI